MQKWESHLLLLCPKTQPCKISIIFPVASKTCSPELIVLISPDIPRHKPVFIKDLQLNTIRVIENITVLAIVLSRAWGFILSTQSTLKQNQTYGFKSIPSPRCSRTPLLNLPPKILQPRLVYILHIWNMSIPKRDVMPVITISLFLWSHLWYSLKPDVHT